MVALVCLRIPRLSALARDLYIDVPVINSIENSNEIQKKNAVSVIMGKGKRNVGVLGLSFKAGTDDLRCSPIVDVVETLLGKGSISAFMTKM